MFAKAAVKKKVGTETKAPPAHTSKEEAEVSPGKENRDNEEKEREMERKKVPTARPNRRRIQVRERH